MLDDFLSVPSAPDISWITPQTSMLEYAIRTRQPGWTIVLDATSVVGICVYDSVKRTMKLHPNSLWRTLGDNAQATELLPPNVKP